MKVRTLVGNGLLAALYIAVSLLIQPFAYGAIQFRLPEVLNHLVVFNKKYFFGIILGVFITNLFSPLGAYDLGFGVAQSVISLAITILCGRFIQNRLYLMIINTIVFTITMFIIAFELSLVFKAPFLITWLYCAIGEFAVMAIGVVIMHFLNKRLHLEKLV